MPIKHGNPWFPGVDFPLNQFIELFFFVQDLGICSVIMVSHRGMMERHDEFGHLRFRIDAILGEVKAVQIAE